MEISKDRQLVRELLVVFAVSVCFYTLTTANNFCEAHDSITYINEIDLKIWFSNPHHLLFRWLGGWWVAAGRLIGSTADSATIVQSMNSIFGGLCLSMFYLFVRRRWGLGPLVAAIATALPALSFGFWYYSTTIEVYIVPLFFLMVALYGMTNPELKERDLYWIGLAHGLACLFHMVHGLFGNVLIACLILQRRQPNFRPFIAFLKYVVVAAPTVILPYLYVIRLRYLNGKVHSVGDVVHWWEGYATESQFWNGIGIKTLIKAIMGAGRSMIGGHFAFASDYLKKITAKALAGKWIMDEEYLVRNMNNGTAMLLLLCCVVLGALIAGLTIIRLRRARLFLARKPVAAGLILVWLAVYCGFFYFWEPMNVEFWIPQSMVLWLLLVGLWTTAPPIQAAAPLTDESTGKSLSITNVIPKTSTTQAVGKFSTLFVATLGTIAALLFITNFFGSVRLLMDHDNDYYYVRSQPFAEVVGQDDLVVLGRAWIIEEYLHRYATEHVLSVTNIWDWTPPGDPDAARKTVSREIRQALADGRSIIVSSDAVTAEPETIAAYGQDFQAALNRIWAPYEAFWIEMPGTLGSIYILRPDPAILPPQLLQAPPPVHQMTAPEVPIAPDAPNAPDAPTTGESPGDEADTEP